MVVLSLMVCSVTYLFLLLNIGFNKAWERKAWGRPAWELEPGLLVLAGGRTAAAAAGRAGGTEEPVAAAEAVPKKVPAGLAGTWAAAEAEEEAGRRTKRPAGGTELHLE